MGSRRVIHSVGIDIGTTTTQVIFSELELVNRASISQVPHYEFARRDIMYVSPVMFTPLDNTEHVRESELGQFIRDQYKQAGLKIEEVESGAIIITGETSKTKNAKSTILDLAKSLGDFVVATAGPHLESIIAGQGSGAGEYSKENASRVLNIDIGGGTANYVVFEAGRVVDTSCLNVGGHLVETFTDGKVKNLREPAKLMCKHIFGDNFNYESMSHDQLYTLIDKMADLVVEVMDGEPSDLAKEMLMTDCIKPNWKYDQVFISGGVGECYYNPQSINNPFMYGDIGPILAESLHKCKKLENHTRVVPKQTVRATVIGAGAYTLSLSGSTIWLNAGRLPIRNIPVLHANSAWNINEFERFAEEWEIAAKRMDLDTNNDLYALALPVDLPVKYKDVVAVSQAVKKFSDVNTNNTYPLLILAKQDIGKVLGMELQPQLPGHEIAVIDEVETRQGDYVDIGKPFFGGQIVPLTVKSLAFPS